MRQFHSGVKCSRPTRSLAALLAVIALLGLSAAGGKFFVGAGGPISSWSE